LRDGLVRILRAIDANVPIVMVSGIDRRQTALAAGAYAFLHYDEGLRIGTVVIELLAGVPRRTTERESKPSDPGP
jgi:cobyrinic acid a,c-diamide synthase